MATYEQHLGDLLAEEELPPALKAAAFDFAKNPFNYGLVDVATFIESKDYCDAKGEVYPACMEAIVAMCSGDYTEAVLTGAIGSGKTTVAEWCQLYFLYVLLENEHPHAIFGLGRESEILIIMQSLKKESAIEVGFKRFKAMVDAAPYFRTPDTSYDSKIKSQLNFKNRITVKPVAGTETGAIGENVIGGIIDELNYMAYVENSKKSPDSRVFDQAVSLYNAIARRRESRFMEMGKVAGMLCLVSSKRYRGQFTDTKEEEAKTNPRIFLYDKRVWDVKPWMFGGEKFRVFVGDEGRNPYIMEEGDEVSARDESLVDYIPVEYRLSFENDILNALRDIAGVSTTAVHPYIVNRDAVADCFGLVDPIFTREWVCWPETKIGIDPGAFLRPEEPRWVHLDLALTSCSAGFAIGHVAGFRAVQRGPHQYEMLPEIVIDGILEIRPPKNGAIEFQKVRELIYQLRASGLNIQWVSADTWQSSDMLQTLKAKGYGVGPQSVDKDMFPYDVTRSAFYDGRLALPEHALTFKELVSLEVDEKKAKVDHRPGGTKDCSDALAGVVFGLSRRREIYARHGVEQRDIPYSLRGDPAPAPQEEEEE